MSDEGIVRAVRRLAAMEDERDRLSERVDRLREAATAQELAERDRWGDAMADLDARILLESIGVLDEMGMRSAATAVQHVAEEEGLPATLAEQDAQGAF
ncbi:hypothetical protein ABZ154_13220 [Streptomyces sp. NPDC006261]|uniref:hypothetical protein n=1 Tax=Streptomyces sp. NPDC006261 TaxID=3156739 RepID=UPI0033BF6DC9